MEYQSWADGMRYETHHGRVVLSHAERPSHIAAMFDEAVARRGGEIAMVDGDLRLTYADVADRADRCATRLLGLGIKPGDRVVILFNGKPLGEGNSAAVPTESLDRGEHRVVVQVVSGAGRVMTSEERVVYVQQPTAQHGARHP